MDYLQELGYLALGSRLKRLSERFGQEVAQVYSVEEIDFEPRWFPIFRLVAERESMSITDIAQAVGITHPAVNQMAQELTSAGLFKASGDPHDKRRRLLSLTAEGKRVCQRLQPVWRRLHAALSDLVAESGTDLVNVATAVETALDRNPLVSRFHRLPAAVDKSSLELRDLSPELAPHFARLNRAWIEKYFAMEKFDFEQLANPDRIVNAGGAVIFACLGDTVVGTCALKTRHGSTFEIIKMAVDEAYRGMGIGRMLMVGCIKRAEALKADSIVLETNSKLKAAVSLYEDLGFKALPPQKGRNSAYQRVDLIMQMDLPARGRRRAAHATATRG